MSLTRKQIMIIGGVFLAIALFIGIFIFLIPFLQRKSSDEPASKISLTVWGIEYPANFSDIMTQYTAAHPNVLLRYTQIPEDRYEQTLLNALATDQGPDIFMIHRSWADRYDDKLIAAEKDQIAPSDLSNLFPAVVGRDFVRNDYVSALPLSIDSLALLYNRDLFDKKGIAVTPKTWGDIKILIPYFTEFTPSNQLKKSAIALGGTSDSIPNTADLLSLFMFQFDSKSLESTNRSILFDKAAENAVDFYTQFSTPNSPFYTWNDSFLSADNAFGSGDAAMSINYSREIPQLIEKNPYLNFGILPLPQNNISAPINYADYWGFTVSPKSANVRFAWKFIVSATTDPAFASLYTKQSGNPPALRELINNSLKDARLGVFAKQALTARAASQYNIATYRESLSRSIKDILSGKFTTGTALEKAATEINNSR